MTTLTDAQVAGYAKGAGFSGGDVPICVAVCHAESGCRTDVVNSNNADGTRDYGLMQINSVHSQLLASGNWQNPDDNMRMAYSVFQSQGWHAWTTYNSGAYKPFLGAGLAASGAAPLTSTPGTAQPVGIVSGTEGALSGIADFARTITDPHTYLRVAIFLAGLFLLFVGLIGFTRVKQGAKLAAKAAEVAAIA